MISKLLTIKLALDSIGNTSENTDKNSQLKTDVNASNVNIRMNSCFECDSFVSKARHTYSNDKLERKIRCKKQLNIARRNQTSPKLMGEKASKIAMTWLTISVARTPRD